MANISWWDPVYNDVRNDVGKIFSEFMPSTMKRFWGLTPGVGEPAVDVIEKDDLIVVKASIPGVNKEDIKLEVHKNVLIIKGEHKVEKEEKKEDYYRKEIQCGSFYRSVELPSDVESESADAVLKDGILEVTLKKVAVPKPIKIEIK